MKQQINQGNSSMLEAIWRERSMRNLVFFGADNVLQLWTQLNDSLPGKISFGRSDIVHVRKIPNGLVLTFKEPWMKSKVWRIRKSLGQNYKVFVHADLTKLQRTLLKERKEEVTKLNQGDPVIKVFLKVIGTRLFVNGLLMRDWNQSILDFLSSSS